VPLAGAFFYTLLGAPPPQKKERDLLIKQNLTFLSKSPVKEPSSMFCQQVPCELRCSVSRDIGVFICVSPSPQLKELSHKMGENIQSPSTERYTDERPIYSVQWGAAWFPKGLFMTLLLPPQCHAAFSLIPSTLA